MKKILITSLFLSFTGYLAFNQEPAGDRVISMQIDMAEDEPFTEAFKYADSACVKVIHMSFPWDEVEKDTNDWDFARIDTMFKQAASIPGLQIEMNLPPLNMGWKTVPADLASDSLNSARTLRRYKAYIDTVFNHLGNSELYTLNIGNEHGLYLLGQWPDTSRIVHFKAMHKEAAQYAKAKYAAKHSGADLPVGTTLTYAELVHSNTWWFMQKLNNALSDVISCNYYGIYDNGTVKDTGEVRADFDSLLNVYGGKGKDILITECGYPSSDSCNSSEEKQKYFVESVFSSWDKYKDDIKYISFFTLTDWTWEVASYITDAMAVHDSVKVSFRNYLHTLGWRNYDGSQKMSMHAIIDESKKRCFCPPLITPRVSTSQSIEKGDTAILIAQGGKAFSWSTSDINDTIFVRPNTTTTYYVTVSDVYQCSSEIDSVTITVTTSTSGIDKTTIKADKYGMKVYPNPPRNSFFTEFNPKNYHPWMVKVIDMKGNIMFLQKGFGEKKMKLEIHTRDYQPGVYAVILWIDNERFTKNIVIE
jgi:hypothetical protein